MSLVTLALEAVQDIATSLVLAVLVFVVGLICARLFGKLILLLLHEFSIDYWFEEVTTFRLPVEHTIAAIVTYTIYGLTLIFSLSILGIATTLVNVIAIIVGFIVLLYVMLTLSDFIPNAVAGLTLATRKSIRPGKVITAQGFTGVVRHFGLIETSIATTQGDVVTIPNKLLTKHPVVVHKVDKLKTLAKSHETTKTTKPKRQNNRSSKS